MLKSIINNGFLFFILIICVINETLYSQLTPGGIGSFESNLHGKWKAAPENSDFTNSDSDFFEQSGSLKVISGGEHTLINYDASNFNKQISHLNTKFLIIITLVIFLSGACWITLIT